MTDTFKTKFLRARSREERIRVLREAAMTAAMRTPKLEDVLVEVPLTWWPSVELNVRALVDLYDGLDKIHGDTSFHIKTFALDLHFTKHTTPAELYDYAERIAAAVAKEHGEANRSLEGAP